jgi:predicted TIM-barrel enzyme
MLDFTINFLALIIGYTCGYIYAAKNKTISGVRQSWAIHLSGGPIIGKVDRMTVDEVCLFCTRYYGGVVHVDEKEHFIVIKK